MSDAVADSINDFRIMFWKTLEYNARLAAQIVEWEEHPEVYERWLRANEPSKLWKELRAIKCKFMGLPYSDLDFE